MALEHYKTQVLLLHSQQSTLDVLSSGFNDRYSVHCATSGTEALNTLHDTPIHVIVFAQDLPGMSGLEALREAKKRSPDTIGILLAGTDHEDGLEALVGDKEVFQIVRGKIEPPALIELIEAATKRVRLMALSESANDQRANVDEPVTEHIVMETSENGSTIISDGTGTMPALKPHKIEIAPGVGARGIDVLVLTKDEEFLATIKDSARGLHNIHHSVTPTQAEDVVKKNKVGVLVTDAAMVGSHIESLTQKLRRSVPRLVAIVAGRRDDGEMLMDLINRGHVYRFLLKPVSPGRSRLAIEASVKHHLEAPDTAFKGKPKAAAPAPKPVAAPKPKPAAKAKPVPKSAPKPAAKPQGRPAQKITPTISESPLDDVPLDAALDGAFSDEQSFTDTMTGIAISVGKSISGATSSATGGAQGMAKSSVAAVAGLTEKIKGPFAKPRMLAMGGGAIAVIALVGWLVTSWEFTPDEAVADVEPLQGSAPVQRVVTPPVSRPRTTEQESRAEEAPVTTTPAVSQELREARDARDTGRLIYPAGDNAIELYLDALSRTPNDAIVQTELNGVVNQVLGIAESAMLDRDAEEVATALYMVELADANNPRLTFLNAQLTQLQIRDTADQARIAIREGRFEDAGALISRVRALAGTDSVEVNLLSQELTAAQSTQQAGEIITLANERLEADDLISPEYDNAKYFFEQALEVDPQNQAAQQGLIAVASKLVLKARESMDAGQLDNAENLLNDARALDPSSAALVASTVALSDAREAVVAAARRAEAERLAEIERQAEAQRLAEIQRQAELERQAEAQRQAELERQAEQERQAAAARQAEIDRQAGLRQRAERQAELDRQAEIERQAERERQAAAVREAEAERIVEQQRQAEAAETAKIRAEQEAAKAATSSPLGVGGSAVAITPKSGNASLQATTGSRSEAANSAPTQRTVTPTPATTTGGNAAGASTFAMSGSSNTDSTGQSTRSIPAQAAPRQATIISGTTLGPAAAANSAPAEPEMLPVSRLTRTNYVAPQYPRTARRRNITGSVDITFTVTTDGKVRSLSVVRSEPGETFEQAALDAVTQWRFEPYIENGTAVEKRTAVRLAFSLE